jgi:pimeloyl-ACP methyl ester carboxylesterase
VRQLAGKVSLFIPELPGYGISTPAKNNSRKDVGEALLEALQRAFALGAQETLQKKRRVVLGGHDRGARLCHHLAVWSGSDPDHFIPGIEVVGVILLDIVPTKVQWEKFADPSISQGYFHWPLLANVDRAVKMISAYGGGNWCRDAHTSIAGNNELGHQRIVADDAVEVYATLFDKEETLRYSCLDYATGAAPEYDCQAADQAAGRKIAVPTMVMFSQARLGARIDVANEWKTWIADGVPYEPAPIGHGFGHYLPEEAHDIVSEQILLFLDKHIHPR